MISRTTRHTGAYWFLWQLWEYYCGHLQRPLSDAQHFFIGQAVVLQDSMLPVLRTLWARHLRGLRRDWVIARIAQINRDYVFDNHSPGPIWRELIYPERCRLHQTLRQSYPRLTQDQVLRSIETQTIPPLRTSDHDQRTSAA